MHEAQVFRWNSNLTAASARFLAAESERVAIMLKMNVGVNELSGASFEWFLVRGEPIGVRRAQVMMNVNDWE